MMDNDSQSQLRRTVSSTKPWLLVVMIDGSHSMSADWGGSKRPMSGFVEQAVNQLLFDMALNYSTSDETDESALKDRIHLRLLVYSGEADVDDPIPLPQGIHSPIHTNFPCHGAVHHHHRCSKKSGGQQAVHAKIFH